MNTFHPNTDEDYDVADSHGYPDDDDIVDYEDISNNGLRDHTIDTRMLPPDDSINDMELWENKRQANESPNYAQKPKSGDRYERQQETANFKGGRKNWEPRNSDLTTGGDRYSYQNYNLNQKDRQFVDRSGNYNEMNNQNYYPDVSQINEEEFMESESYNNMPSRVNNTNFEDSEKLSEVGATLLEVHNDFFSKLRGSGLFDVNSQEFQEMENELREFVYQNAHSKDPSTVHTIRQKLAMHIQKFKQKMSEPVEQRPSEVMKRPNENIQFYRNDQNMHPNINQQMYHDESKLDASMLEESSLNNQKRFNQMARNNPITPESVNRRYRASNAEIELGERAKRFDDAMDNPSPIQPVVHRPIEEEEDDRADEQENEEEKLTMAERLANPKWQIRKNAYKAVAEMFTEYSDGKDFSYIGPNDEEIAYNPLEKYQEWLLRMIRDTNLVAQIEGLNTLLEYVRIAPDIKNATMSALPDLLDKINHNKSNFTTKATQIIMLMFEKDMGHHIMPELLKRFKSARNRFISEFCINLLIEVVKSDMYMHILNLKHIFNGLIHPIKDNNKSLRDAGIALLTEIYIRVDDDVNSILKHMKGIRPAFKTTVKEALTKVEKLEGSEEYRIFSKAADAHNADNDDSTTPVKDRPNRDDMRVMDISEDVPVKDSQDDGKIELISLVSDGFDRLPYVTQIPEKKKTLEELYKKLCDAFKAGKTIVEGDNYKVYNVLKLMLEDTNALVQLEAINIIKLLAMLKDSGLKGKYAKIYVEILFERFKETKSAVLKAIRETLDAFMENEIIGADALIHTALNLDNNKSVKTKKIIVSSTSKSNNPRSKQNAIEFVKKHLSECNEAMESGEGMDDSQLSFIQGMFN